MSRMNGWVKLHRQSLDHWLYNESRPHTRREAWEDMLLLANHEDNKVMIQGELIECNSGQSVMSLKNWAKQFKWTIQQVRTFFSLLQKDKMITLEGMRKTTRVTICNYALYQKEQHTDNTQTTHKQHTGNTQITSNKNDKKEENEKILATAQTFYSDQCSLNPLDEKYKQLIDFMLGANDLNRPLYSVLKLRDQLTADQFLKLRVRKKKDGLEVNIMDSLIKIDNDEKYTKGKSSLYTILLNWLTQRFVKNVR